MTFLPIVQRELRIAARRRGTYWTRLAVALPAAGIGVVTFALTLGNVSPQQTGKFIFQGLAGLLLLYCLAYGRRATADCLSLEKRDGTLGLLFLTDLKGHDVVLGKLAATSLGGFYGLLAVLPVLSVCLLLGGVTSGEFWRMALVLVDTFLLSLGIGMLGSAMTRDFRRAMAANFLLLLAVVILLPALAVALAFFSTAHRFMPGLLYTCPPYAFYLSFDSVYRSAPAHFWGCVGTIHGVTWLLVLAASWVVPLSWQDQPTRNRASRWRELWQRWNFGQAEMRPAFRRQLLEVNAYYWLAARARLKPVHVWTFLGFMTAWWCVGWMTSGEMWFDVTAMALTALMLNFALKVWVAIEAGQELADDQRSGAVELLLSVPLTVREILRGQLLALRRQFLKPALVVIGVELVFMWSLSLRAPTAETIVTWLAMLVILVADLFALAGVAMLRALTARNHNHATVGTLLRILVLPWALFGIIVGGLNLWFVLSLGPEWSPSWEFYLALWFGFSLAVDLFFGLSAWWQLRTKFREIALRRFNPAPSRFAQWLRRHKPAVVDPLGRRPKALAASASPGSPVVLAGRNTMSGSVPVGQAIGGSHVPASGAQERKPAGASENAGSPGGTATAAEPADTSRRLWRRRAIVGGAVLCLACVAAWWLWPRPSIPPPITVALSQSKGPLRVFPGVAGVFMILPDGSLWRWGQAGGSQLPRATVPEQVGTNTDWMQVAGAGRHCAGLRTDGTIWEWGSRGSHLSSEPEQIDSGHVWVGIGASLTHSVALRRDGTVWAWGQNAMGQLGNGPGPSQTNFVQVGTNNDWSAVSGYWNSTFALRKDGTLWVWGGIWYRSSGTRGTMKNFVWPTRVCAETNWSGFIASASPLVRNRSGELWDPTFAAPNPDAPAPASCRLVSTNSGLDRAAVAMVGATNLYEVRSDGSLWEKEYQVGSGTGSADDKWRRVGQRSDWVSLWGGGGTVLGLTSDGTVWTWGLDPGREPVFGISSKLNMARARFQAIFGTRAPGGFNYSASPPYNQEPRPLMRMTKATN